MDTPVTIGRILSPHGIKGEVKVMPLTDFPKRFEKTKKIWIDIKDAFLEIENVRFINEFPLIKFAGIDDRDEAEKLRNGLLQIPSDQVMKLPPGHYYHFQIIGLNVYDPEGKSIGRVEEIIETGANDIYVVKREGKKELLVPALKDVVVEIDISAGRMVVKIPPGLDD